MIQASIAAFINAQAEFSAPGIALKAFVKTPDTVLGELPAPFCLVTPVTEPAQELWEIGDAHRKENPLFQVAFYATAEWKMRHYETIFRRMIESATATDVGSLTHPGINYLAVADLLRDTGDHKNYLADQPDWFASPTPIVYKNEDSNGEPIVVASGYTVDLTLGKVTFSSANLTADLIRATYKVGVIDFNIVGVAHFETAQDSDMANNPQRYVVVFDLEPHFFVKTTANRHI